MAEMSDAERLVSFVQRARRIAAHSLVQDRDALQDHARGEINGYVSISGQITITLRLPENEEVFESLASRLRPLTVQSEPIYYVKVFDSIENLVRGIQINDSDSTRLMELRRAWESNEIQGTQVQRYAVQSVKVDGTEGTNIVSDTQLAAAWLYADLVHADAKGPKKEALAFTLRDRYEAAVRLFSRLAILTIDLLQLIESLTKSGAVTVPDSVWDEEVVIGASEFVQEARAFFAPVGTIMPDLRDSLRFDGNWTQLTVTELLRQNSANQVRISMTDESGQETTTFDAAVSRRFRKESTAEWEVLVAGSVTFKFAFDFEGDQLSDVRFRGMEMLDSTNELKLASIRLLTEFYRATAVVFEVHGERFLSTAPPDFSCDEFLDLGVIEETVSDIVAIERLVGQEFAPCNGGFNDLDRVSLRRTRLMWQGNIVNAMRRPVIVTAPEGSPPQIIAVQASSLDIGDSQVPTPIIYMRHPNMIAVEDGVAPDVGKAAKKFKMEPPEGQRFIAWSPDHVQVANDSDLVVTAAWGLLGVDEETFIY